MLVIIGGSGMLFEASRELTATYPNQVLLCGRQHFRYEPILTAHSNSRFFEFDFSEEHAYQALGDYLLKQQTPLSFLVWVHSPYYAYLVKLLLSLESQLKVVYLVKGSQSVPLSVSSPSVFPLVAIQLGKHPVEDRWLTHQEICQQVLAKIALPMS